MTFDTEMAGVLDAAGSKIQYDEWAKRMLSEKAILAWLLKECADEFRDVSVNEMMNGCMKEQLQVSVVAVD